MKRLILFISFGMIVLSNRAQYLPTDATTTAPCYAAGGCTEYISRVTCGLIDETTTCSGYEDQTSFYTQIPLGGSDLLTVYNGAPFFPDDRCGVWVDWNDDGDFDDPGETLPVTGSPGIGPYTCTVAPPNSSLHGSKTMRIRISPETSLSPCGITPYGEVEDYSIIVVPAPPNYWSGTANHDWSDPSNWSLGHVPLAYENVYIPPVGYQPVMISANVACYSITILDAGQLEVGDATLDVRSQVNIYGHLSQTSPASVIRVGEVWNNVVGPAAFSAGPGRVVFTGVIDNPITTEEHFHILEVDVPGWLYLTGSGISCDYYDWTRGGVMVQSGNTFTASDLIDNGISGTIYVTSGGTVNLANATTGRVDLNGHLQIYGGAVNVTGTVSEWPHSHDASLVMVDGTLDFTTCGISVVQNSFALDVTLNGGTIRTAGGFSGNRPDFTPGSGIFEFYGTADISLSATDGCQLWDVIIDKDPPVSSSSALHGVNPGKNAGARNAPLLNAVSLAGDLTIANNFLLQTGTFHLNGHTLRVNGTSNIFGDLEMDNPSDHYYAGESEGDYLNFHPGSWATLSAGFLYPASWIVFDQAHIEGTPGHTTQFTGSGEKGIQTIETDPVLGNLALTGTGCEVKMINSDLRWLTLQGDLTLSGGCTLQMQGHKMRVIGNVISWEGSTLNLNIPLAATTSSTPEHPGKEQDAPLSLVQMITEGYLTLHGSLNIPGNRFLLNGNFLTVPSSSIYILGDGEMVITSPGDGSPVTFDGHLTMESGGIEISNNGLVFAPDFTSTITGGTLRVNKGFGALYPGNFAPVGGVVEIMGNVPFNYSINCQNGNSFYDLTINRPAGIVCYQASTSMTIRHNFLILGGSYGFVNNGSTLTVGGNWTNASATGAFLYGNSTVNFNGNEDQTILINPATDKFYHLTISGQARFRPVFPIEAKGNISMNSGTWEDITTGLTHTCWGNFQVNPGAAFLGTATSNTMKFKGVNNAIIDYSSSLGNLHHVVVEKNQGLLEFIHYSTVNGDLTIVSGTLQLESTFILKGDAVVQSGGTLKIIPMGPLVMSNGRTCQVYGTLIADGTGFTAIIDSDSPDAYYNLNVNAGGKIGAKNAQFRKMGLNGLLLVPGSQVLTENDMAFFQCRFSDGIPGGTLLTINNNQNMDINSAIFPTNYWMGASNVTKSVNSGFVRFLGYYGDFSGENYDSDPYSRVTWIPLNQGGISGNLSSGDIQCYDAINILTIAGSGFPLTVNAGASLTGVAGSKIRILEGMTVYPGGYFHGYITPTGEYCGSAPPSLPAVQPRDKSEAHIPETENRFILYPNPSTGVCTLQYQGAGSPEDVQITVYSAHGQQISSLEYKAETIHRFDIREALPGLYFVRIIHQGQSEIHRLVLVQE